jgi:hypothetical protein
MLRAPQICAPERLVSGPRGQLTLHASQTRQGCGTDRRDLPGGEPACTRSPSGGPLRRGEHDEAKSGASGPTARAGQRAWRTVALLSDGHAGAGHSEARGAAQALRGADAEPKRAKGGRRRERSRVARVGSRS